MTLASQQKTVMLKQSEAIISRLLWDSRFELKPKYLSPDKIISKYDGLSDQQMQKVCSVFDKIFGHSFQGYNHNVHRILSHSSLNPHILQEVSDEVKLLTNNVLDQIMTGTGAFANKKRPNSNSNSGNKRKKARSKASQGKIEKPILHPIKKLTPEQLKKKAYILQMMKLKPEDCQEQMQAAQELIKKLKKEKIGRMERFRHKEEEIIKMEQDHFQDVLKRRAEDEEKKQREIEQRREQIKIKMQLMREERERRQREWSEQKQVQVFNYNPHRSQMSLSANGTTNSTPLYQKVPLFLEMEDKFKKTYESEQLNKRKMILQQIRQFKRPIQREEFEEHARKYEDDREKKLEEKLKIREDQLQQFESQYDPNKFKTKTYQEVALYDLQQKEELETKEEMKKLLIEKKESYARYVREMHLPPRNKGKEQELQEMISSLKHPVRSSRKYPPGTDISAIKRTRSSSRGGANHSRNISINQNGDEDIPNNNINIQEDSNGHSNERSLSLKRKMQRNNGLLAKPPLHNAFKTIQNIENKANPDQKKPQTDYLKERRLKREKNISTGIKESWLKSLNLKKLSKKEKFLKIKEKAREIEELALRKEQLMNAKANNDNMQSGGNQKSMHPMAGATMGGVKDERNIDETLEVNEMLIDAIKAKLAILDDIN
ncbi:UNKNOWN [Stylonychia lemnae]|uniref:Uncharacterized protein n=1 Tax=Stylonychia lemnae TaxID=5949 RepID=A0A078A839_STYLE|nr:UNKNOWN [Stylonychia lemnae]|eukprot:CDW78384.1 UNKNOWN [Stylonychia lemnae]